MPGRNWVDVSIHDEPHSRRYLVRFYYSVDEYDPGNTTTPAFAGDVLLEDAQVREATQFDFQGQPAFTDREASARQYTDRVWQLLDANSSLREQVNSACWDDYQSSRQAPQAKPSTPARPRP